MADASQSHANTRSPRGGAPAKPAQSALRRNAEQTPPTLWCAVVLLATAAGCLGGFVVSLHSAPTWAQWLLLGLAVALAVPGLALAWRGHMMQDAT